MDDLNKDELELWLKKRMQPASPDLIGSQVDKLRAASEADQAARQDRLMAGLLESSAQIGSYGGSYNKPNTQGLLASADENRKAANAARGEVTAYADDFQNTRSKAITDYLTEKRNEQQRKSDFEAKMKEKEEERKWREEDRAEQRKWQEQQNDLNRSASGQRAMTMSGLANARYQDRLDEKMSALHVPGYGEANTPDDAKQLKAAVELKQNFDRKLTEMIALRESKGSEVLDREAVQRGQQLSKDLLLLYKDMAKLGVLSQSDEAILNAIIPSDPLEWNASQLAGQDPTMHRLKKFKADSEADFQSRLATRLKNYKSKAVVDTPADSDGGTAYAQTSGKKVTAKQYSPSRNQTRITYSDGTTEVVDGKQ